MRSTRTHATALVLALMLGGCAQTGTHTHAGRGPGGMGPMAGPMGAMHEWHERMARAQTAEERHALMAEHRKLMQDEMAARGMGRGMDDCMAPRKPGS